MLNSDNFSLNESTSLAEEVEQEEEQEEEEEEEKQEVLVVVPMMETGRVAKEEKQY